MANGQRQTAKIFEMKKWIVNSFLILALVTVSAYLVFASGWLKPDYDETLCENLRISIDAKYKLITSAEIVNLLEANNINPQGKYYDQIREDEIEQLLTAHPFVKLVECYHLPNSNTIQLDILLREPIFIVGGLDSYYVDSEKEILPLSIQAAAYLPLLSGTVTHQMAVGKLFDLMQFIGSDPFWNSQIEQVYVRNDLKIELIPRVGDAVILLGDMEDYKEKLDRVYRLYDKGFGVLGWNRYSLLDLQYDGQIVCTKAEKL